MKYRCECSYKNLGIDFVNEWSQIGKRFNWYNMTLIKVAAENEQNIGNSEIELYFLGFGIRLYWISNAEVFNKKMERWEKNIMGVNTK